MKCPAQGTQRGMRKGLEECCQGHVRPDGGQSHKTDMECAPNQILRATRETEKLIERIATLWKEAAQNRENCSLKKQVSLSSATCRGPLHGKQTALEKPLTNQLYPPATSKRRAPAKLNIDEGVRRGTNAGNMFDS